MGDLHSPRNVRVDARQEEAPRARAAGSAGAVGPDSAVGRVWRRGGCGGGGAAAAEAGTERDSAARANACTPPTICDSLRLRSRASNPVAQRMVRRSTGQAVRLGRASSTRECAEVLEGEAVGEADGEMNAGRSAEHSRVGQIPRQRTVVAHFGGA